MFKMISFKQKAQTNSKTRSRYALLHEELQKPSY